MSNPRYTEEFKIEAVKQVADRGHSHLRGLTLEAFEMAPV